MDVSNDYHDAQRRIRELNEQIEKHRTFLECGATTDDHYEDSMSKIEELVAERDRIRSYWNNQ
jgi:hypothetical protein